jgi:hypothetical protein
MPSVSELALQYNRMETAVGRVTAPGRYPARNPNAHIVPPAWADVPPDMMRLIVELLPLHDVQSTLLVCREWRNGFANGLLELKPRQPRVERLALR